MPDTFHFLEPAWLLLAIPAALLLWWRSRSDRERGPWSDVVDRPLQPLLLTPAGNRQVRLPLWLLGLGWLVALIALANPAWERVPAPLWQAGPARVIVLDLSRSMLAADLRPTRLFQARLKVEDLLSAEDGGEIGLVVFAGDAFTVAPLTRDASTLRGLLKVLEPGLMPAQGSRVDLGLAQAHELLRQAEVASGEVILIVDGVEDLEAALDATAHLHRDGHRVSVLGVGSVEGAPLPGGREGRPFVIGLDKASLVAIAETGGGRYAQLSPAGGDIAALLLGYGGDDQAAEGLQTWRWQGRGILLLPLLLPLGAMAFRRGWLLTLALLAVLPLPSQPVFASAWNDAWSRPDQQAADALVEGRYDRARFAEDPMVSGAAAYRQGRFSDAEQAFAVADGADAAYNRGNSLARMGRYREAVAAYDRALGMAPGMPDAVHNKAAVEALLQAEETSARREQEDPSEQSDDADEQASSSDDADQHSEQRMQDAEQQDGDDVEQADANAGDPDEDTVQEQAGGDDADAQGNDSGGETDTAQGEDAGEQAGETASTAADGDADGEGQSGDGDATSDAGGSRLSSASSGSRDRGDPSQKGQDGTSVSDSGASPDADASDPGKQVAGSDRIEDRGEPGQQEEAQAQQVSAGDRQSDAAGGGDQDEQSSSGGAPERADGRADNVGQSFAEANRRLDDRPGDEEGNQRDDGLDASRRDGTFNRVGSPDETDGEPAPGGAPGGTRPVLAAPSLSVEEKLAAQQWLRRIPDDPGGLLRRKFLLQYRQRGRTPQSQGQDW